MISEKIHSESVAENTDISLASDGAIVNNSTPVMRFLSRLKYRSIISLFIEKWTECMN